jgi:hypothetical protein
MQHLGPRALWLLCFAVALLVSVGHLVTAEPRRRRIAALTRSEKEEAQIEAQPPTEALSG